MGASDLDGVVFREAWPDDAEQIIKHVRRVADEPDSGIILEPGEFSRTVEEQRKMLEEYAASDNSVFIVAEADGQIVGVMNCKGGPRRAIRHAALLGITVHRTWRGRGVGTALMEQAKRWARDTGIVTRIELEVMTHNARAIHVYEKCGFKMEGMKRRAYFRNGQYVDGFVMAWLLDDEGR